MTDVMLIEEKTLICGMCGRRICDITVAHGRVLLLRVSRRVGIPQQVPEGRGGKVSGAARGQRSRNPNVRIFADDSDGRFRIVHEHKRNGRGPLDRTVNAATMEKLYNAAVAADEREVVLN